MCALALSKLRQIYLRDVQFIPCYSFIFLELPITFVAITTEGCHQDTKFHILDDDLFHYTIMEIHMIKVPC